MSKVAPSGAGSQHIASHVASVRACSLCFPGGGNVPVVDDAKSARAMLVGQAPGITEVTTRRPFTGPAGRRLDGWLERAGVGREEIFFSAVARCFPGKAKGGGDKIPSRRMIENCRAHLDWELENIKPEVVVLIGGLAIKEILGIKKLSDAAGRIFRRDGTTYVPLPHPSGASTWLNPPENRALLEDSLEELGRLMADSRRRDEGTTGRTDS